MITSPSRNDLISGSVRLHNADVPVRVTNASIAVTIAQEKELQNG